MLKICRICNKEFKPKKKKQVCCSKHCGVIMGNITRNSVRYIDLPEVTKQVIYGSLLGDSWFDIVSNEYRICYCHGECQEEYIKWKHNLIKDFSQNITTRIRKGHKTWDNKQFNEYKVIEFNTRSHPFISQLKEMMYKGGRKILRRTIINRLSPLGLAIWFMDDGSGQRIERISKTGKQNVYIIGCLSIGNQPERIAKTIVKYFKVSLGINCRYYSQIGKNSLHYRIKFNSTEFKKLINIIGPYVIPSMRYKIEKWKDNNWIPKYNIEPLTSTEEG